MNLSLFNQQLFVGHISYVTPEFVKLSFPDFRHTKRFDYYGSSYYNGIAKSYVIIEGDGIGFLGRIIKVDAGADKRDDFSEFSMQGEKQSLHPYADVELLLSFDIYDLSKIEKGLSTYPPIGARVFSCDENVLGLFYNEFGKNNNTSEEDILSIGTLPQKGDIDFKLSAQALFGRHCAVVGTTGSGKSYTVAKLIESLVSAESHGRKLILIDPTGEYSQIKGDSIIKKMFGINGDIYMHYSRLKTSDLFSLFRPAGQTQIPVLMDAIQDLKLVEILKKEKTSYIFFSGEYIEKERREKNDYEKILEDNAVNIDSESITFDIKKLPQQIENECVWDTDKSDLNKWGLVNEVLKQSTSSLILRIRSRLANRFFTSCFGLKNKTPGSKDFDNVLNNFIKNDKERLFVIDVSQVPFDENLREILLNSIGRLFLKNAEQDKFKYNPIILFIDEAHLLFGTEKIKDEYSNEFKLDAFERIAKESRKRGLFLCLATQRPRDIPVGVLSQMGSFVAHRLINQQDRDAIEGAAPEGSKYSFAFLPALGKGEAVIVGVDFPTSAHIKIQEPGDNFKPDSGTPILFKKKENK